MAFIASPERFSRRRAARHAAETLAAWLQGREKAYAVHDALHELRALFHEGAAIPCRLVLDAMNLSPDDEQGRAALVTRALDMIDRQTRADTDE